MRRRPFGVLAFFVVACLDPTQATLDLTTNAPCGGEEPAPGTLYETGILASNVERAKTGDLNTTTTTCGADGTIGSIVLHPANGAREASVVAVGALGSRTAQECLEASQGRREGGLGDCIIARRRVSFVDNQGLRLPVLLDNACAGVDCPDDSTCVRDTDDGGNLVTRCVSAVVDCADDGTCDPATVSVSATTGTGGGPTGSGGGTIGSGGAGGGSAVQALTANAVSTPGLVSVTAVSGDSTGVLVAGTPQGVFRAGSTTPIVQWTGIASPAKVLESTSSSFHALAFEDGSAVVGATAYPVAGSPDTVVDIHPEQATSALAVLGNQSTTTLVRITATGFATLETDSSAMPGQAYALSGSGPSFLVGTRACYWAGEANPLDCIDPSVVPLLDVWSEGAIGYAISEAHVVTLTSALGETVKPMPVDPSLTALELRSVDADFTADFLWVGGAVGSPQRAYLARRDASDELAPWREYVSNALPPVEDIWVASSTSVFFVAGGSLYIFNAGP